MKTRILILTLSIGLTGIAACDEGPLEPDSDPFTEIVAVRSDQAPDDAGHAHGSANGLRVLSRNVFLGADLEPVVGAVANNADPSTIAFLVGQAWGQVLANNFPARARAIAREIAASDADVVGLQEVALFRTESPANGPAVPATDTALDYLGILMAQLEARGARYSVAAVGSSIDIELPAAVSPTDVIDVRYTDRDVILVKEGIEVTESISDTYAQGLPVTEGFVLPRGYNRVELVHEGRLYRVVNTHLETDEASVPVQTAQAVELASIAGVPSIPTIVVGDLNGQPAAAEDGTRVYEILTSAGFTDAWTPTPSDPDGYTCCFDKDLVIDPGEDLFERIDYVFVRGGGERPVSVLDAYTVGAGRRYGTVEDERWPSDHAGVFAAITRGPIMAE